MGRKLLLGRWYASCYLCDFVVRYVKIPVYLESPQKINFNLGTFLVNEISEKTGFNYS